MSRWWFRVTEWGRRVGILRQDSRESAGGDRDYVPSPEDFPTFPPPPPKIILQDQTQYLSKVAGRKFAAPTGYFEDSSLFALYRLYELFILDHVLGYRNTLEAFWRHQEWSIKDIPDPDHTDPERYAFLAGCTYLLVRSFNQRVKIGLRRDMTPLITPEEAEVLRNVPDHLRPYEKVPDWAVKAPPLAETLVIPTHDKEVLEGKDDSRADPDFLAKNILLWTPHIYFT
ncbi:DNA-binding protein [Phialemonium atrogriseum]|uniref:DNA-binding protein n=1 Tax=Phialemonium atrogriseum TaxID=1093897 RepID=A0AAJ0C2X6_9PEZI|nr:DNA-binding protein [Phialemonium atrogriseum]KAK1768946.1 DNA-binding protein [Phialemonium atrogriseum]